ncbi:MAG: DUF2029 domain-containing protein [Bacteroidetes bacterium]|nr:DUF2029 domain-containing protein [Bacteroidota bacterium]
MDNKYNLNIVECIFFGLVTIVVGKLLLQLYGQVDLFPVDRIWLGMDYGEFYFRFKDYLNDGKPPYYNERFVTPPLSLFVGGIFQHFKFEVAVKLFLGLNVFCVFFGILFISGKKLFDLPERGTIFKVMIMLIAFLSFPVHFLIDRGNLDGIVFLLVAIGFYFFRSNKYVTGITWALAVLLKLYPLLLFAMALIRRDRKILVSGLLVMVSFVVLTPVMHYEFVTVRILGDLFHYGVDESIRFANFRMDENGSLVNFFISFLHLIGIKQYPDYLFTAINGLYLLLLCVFLYRSMKIKSNSIVAYFLIIPFMVAIPRIAYLYEYTILLLWLPLICRIDAGHGFSLRMKSAIGLAFIFVFMNTIELERLTHISNVHIIPPLGLTILMMVSMLLMDQKRYDRLSNSGLLAKIR